MEISLQNIASDKHKKPAQLYNPYEGRLSGRQLTETVEEFLSRIPPATTPVSDLVPWIFIANPYRKTKTFTASQAEDEVGFEGPLGEGSDRVGFAAVASRLLDSLGDLRENLEERMVGKAKATITKALDGHRDRVVKDILDAAVRYRYTSGKWMIFAPPSSVNILWASIAKATANNELGIAAKVAPDEGDSRRERLICIYTQNFADVEDVTRVAKKLKYLGLIDTRGRGIYYKCDAYTELGLSSSNPYGIKASMYNSNDLLKGNRDVKLDGFFYKKEKEAGDLKILRCE